MTKNLSTSIHVKKDIAEELHKPARRNYYRRHVYVRGLRDLFQADLVEMIPYEKENDGFRYLLTVIDVFSKYAWARPIRRKNANDVTNAMRDILHCNDSVHLKPPKFLQVDLGKEFYNSKFQKMLNDEFNIKMYSVYSVKKACVIERFNRTLKTRMWRIFSAKGSYRWLDILPTLLHEYNHSIHRSINIAPASVSLEDEKRIKDIHDSYHNNKKRGKVKFKEGDYVRISRMKSVFDKGYLPNWSTELFFVTKVCPTLPVTYHLKDFYGNPIKGGFYNEELQKTKYPDIYLVEKILKRRANKVFVKWLGFPSNQNTWEDEKNIL